MKEISISEIETSRQGLVSARVRFDDTDETVWFELPDSCTPHPDLVATAFAALFGPAFERWEYEGAVSAFALGKLEKVTASKWNNPMYDVSPRAPGARTILNFSGGFDSLAALALYGRDQPLVSMDFGEKFRRERDFFKSFDTAIVATNARQFEKSWTFMGIGSILMADYFKAGYVSFGSILEASPWGMVSRIGPRKGSPVFSVASLEETNPLAGLTEFGTAMLASRAFPEIIGQSLISLADRHTEKYLRKHLLLKLVEDKIGSVDLADCPEPTMKEPLVFGSNFAADFLAPGLWSKCDASRWMQPTRGFEKWAEGKNLSFYWSELPRIAYHPDPQTQRTIVANKHEFGVEPYNATDWEELREVLTVLGFFHTIPGRHW